MGASEPILTVEEIAARRKARVANLDPLLDSHEALRVRWHNEELARIASDFKLDAEQVRADALQERIQQAIDALTSLPAAFEPMYRNALAALRPSGEERRG